LRYHEQVKRFLLWTGLAVACGCNGLFGVDDLRFDAAAGQAASSGSGGGNGGSSSTVTASSSTGSGEGAGSSSGSGGSGGGGGGFAVSCPSSKLGALTDTFDGAALGAHWAAYGSGQVTIDSEALRISPLLDGTDYSGVVSSSRYDARDCFVVLELLAIPDFGDTGSCFFDLSSTSDDELGFALFDGELRPYVEIGSVKDEDSLSYSPTDHRWLRLREAAGTVYHEVSPNGSDWSVLKTRASPGYLDSVVVNIGAGTFSPTTASSDFLRVDNVNAAP
jgi:hypothetical protein